MKYFSFSKTMFFSNSKVFYVFKGPADTYFVKIISKYFLKRFFYFMCFACMCLCTPHVFSAHRDQKRVLGPLAFLLQNVGSVCVGAGNRTLLLCKSNKYSNCWASFPNILHFPILLQMEHLFIGTIDFLHIDFALWPCWIFLLFIHIIFFKEAFKK